MNISDFPENSDTSDDDYCPDDDKVEEVPSEVESDGDPEGLLSESEDTAKRDKRRARKGRKSRKKQRKLDEPTPESSEKSSEISQEQRKQQEEDIWADFMKDTGFQSKTATAQPKQSETRQNNQKGATAAPVPNREPETLKVTQIFEFAGEEVTVEKEVRVDSAEARLLDKTTSTTTRKRSVAGLSGIGSVLNQLGKKPKISTLEKSKLDWDKFKKEENLEEELKTYNKGKNGYLDRQDFLQRADLRRFEIEKDIRSIERNKRMNNTL